MQISSKELGLLYRILMFILKKTGWSPPIIIDLIETLYEAARDRTTHDDQEKVTNSLKCKVARLQNENPSIQNDHSSKSLSVSEELSVQDQFLFSMMISPGLISKISLSKMEFLDRVRHAPLIIGNCCFLLIPKSQQLDLSQIDNIKEMFSFSSFSCELQNNILRLYLPDCLIKKGRTILPRSQPVEIPLSKRSSLHVFDHGRAKEPIYRLDVSKKRGVSHSVGMSIKVPDIDVIRITINNYIRDIYFCYLIIEESIKEI